MSDGKPMVSRPWAWIPSLYFAEGLPYALTISVAVVLYKNLGLSNAAITFYTGWLYLPWVIKPLWSPLVGSWKTRRQWIWGMELLMGGTLAGVALTLPGSHFLQLSLVGFWLLAFSSATHDIAADGFYILANTEQDQAFFSGFRNTAYRVAMIAAQGGLVGLTGVLFRQTGSFGEAWSVAVGLVAVVMLGLGGYHWLILPAPIPDRPGLARLPAGGNPGRHWTRTPLAEEFLRTFVTFFQKPKIATPLLFILLYRLGEAQLVRLVQPFLLDARAAGGLGLDNTRVGVIYGILGVVALLGGGVLGGFLVSRRGLKFWLWPMLLAIHLPDAVFIWLAYVQPMSLSLIAMGVIVEQFGYGFGFTALMLYMINLARGPHPAAHYAVCTGFMALGMMVPGLWSGWLQERLGYPHFFLWVILATIPSFIVAARLPLEPEFGRRKG